MGLSTFIHRYGCCYALLTNDALKQMLHFFPAILPNKCHNVTRLLPAWSMHMFHHSNNDVQEIIACSVIGNRFNALAFRYKRVHITYEMNYVLDSKFDLKFNYAFILMHILFDLIMLLGSVECKYF